jgi:hypothetical protein
MLGNCETSTDRSAAAPAAELPGTDALAQCKVDLEQFVTDVRDKLHQVRQTLERHRRSAAATAADVPPPRAAAPPAAEPRDSVPESFVPQRAWEVAAERQTETAAAPPIATYDSDALQAAAPSSLQVDPQDQLQSLKARLARQLQGTPAAGHPLTS